MKYRILLHVAVTIDTDDDEYEDMDDLHMVEAIEEDVSSCLSPEYEVSHIDDYEVEADGLTKKVMSSA